MRVCEDWCGCLGSLWYSELAVVGIGIRYRKYGSCAYNWVYVR